MNDAESNGAAIGKRVRHRRGWYRRRLRMRRILLAVVLGTVIVGSLWKNAARYFSLPTVHSAQVLSGDFWGRADVYKDFTFTSARLPKPAKFHTRIPGVYPYSVVPGGVKDASDLRYAALRDYVVRRHFAHFDYNHAQLVRNAEARQVYLSYRIRDRIFWTRRKARLRIGEMLLTDGKITARARCGNQISDVAKPEVSDEEPDEDVLDQPVLAVDATPMVPIRPVLAPPDLPNGQPVPPVLFGGIFSFPYVPIGVPIPSGLCRPGYQMVDGRCRKHHKPPAAPEPSTMLLLGSGLALILWRYRRAARPVAA